MPFDVKEYQKKYYQENKERKKAAALKIYADNRETRLEQMREYGKSYRKTDRSAVVSKEERQRLRVEVLLHYGGVCQCCGETKNEFLAIDHVEGKGNQHRKSINRKGAAFYRWLRMNEYPDGYRVLCHNCNCARGYYGYCPHENNA